MVPARGQTLAGLRTGRTEAATYHQRRVHTNDTPT